MGLFHFDGILLVESLDDTMHGKANPQVQPDRCFGLLILKSFGSVAAVHHSRRCMRAFAENNAA
jgi:hypothetical protein